jgi:hypothetical protein
LIDDYEPHREPFAAWLVGVAQERSAGRPFPRSSARFRLAGSP